MKLRNVIGNSQGQVLQHWMASCLAMTLLGFVCTLLSFSLKGFTFITAGERSVTCGKKVMKLRNNIGNSQGQVFQFRMASCLAMTKCVPYHDVQMKQQCTVALFTRLLVLLSTYSLIHLFTYSLIYSFPHTKKLILNIIIN